jgi:hypothetical protein
LTAPLSPKAIEDAVEKVAPAEDIDKAQAEVDTSIREVTSLIERLRAKKKTSSPIISSVPHAGDWDETLRQKPQSARFLSQRGEILWQTLDCAPSSETQMEKF